MSLVNHLEDPSTRIIAESKRRHFENSVYLVTEVLSSASSNADDVIYGVNLTRATEQKPDVVSRMELNIDAWQQAGLKVALSLGGPVMPSKITVALAVSGIDSPEPSWTIGELRSVAANALSRRCMNRDAELRIFFGQARWTRSQLLGEIARGSWGVALAQPLAAELSADYGHCQGRGGLWEELRQQSSRLHWAPCNPMRDDYYRRAEHLPGSED